VLLPLPVPERAPENIPNVYFRPGDGHEIKTARSRVSHPVFLHRLLLDILLHVLREMLPFFNPVHSHIPIDLLSNPQFCLSMPRILEQQGRCDKRGSISGSEKDNEGLAQKS
jgi:hypothetical protein